MHSKNDLVICKAFDDLWPKTLQTNEYTLKITASLYFQSIKQAFLKFPYTSDCQTPISKDAPPKTSVVDTVLSSKEILGGLYHSYKKVA